MSTYQGACHCGAVRFEVTGVPEEFTKCDCTLCVKKNAVMWKVPEAALRIVSGEEQLSEYRWNTKVARHFFCSRCGIYTFHKKRSAPDHYGVNIFCLENFDHPDIPIRTTNGAAMSVI